MGEWLVELPVQLAVWEAQGVLGTLKALLLALTLEPSQALQSLTHGPIL